MDTSDLMDDVSGWIPWLPLNLSDAHTIRWADGLRWESRYFDADEEAAKIRPEDLHKDLRKERMQSLLKLHKVTGGNLEHLFHQTVMMIDRLLLTQGGLPEEVTVLEAVVGCYLTRLANYRGTDDVMQAAGWIRHTLQMSCTVADLMACVIWIEMILGEFSRTDVHTPADWLRRMAPPGSFTDSHIDTVFMYLGLQGSLSHYTPSSVAAAVMVKFMDTKAEPYMCGYDLMEVAIIQTEVDRILNENIFL